MMDDRRPGDIPRLWREQPPESPYMEDPPPPISLPDSAQWEGQRYTWRHWLADLTPRQQLGYGCIGVVILSTLFLYCVGASTFFVRPILMGHAVPTPTNFIPPTLAPTPTAPPQPTFIIPLPTPRGTMPPTPTQAPLPTYSPATVGPTLDNYGFTPTRKPTTRP